MKQLHTQLAILVLVLTMTAACSDDSTQLGRSPMPDNPLCYDGKPMPGSWRDAEVTPEAQAALDSVLARTTNSSPLERILTLKTQLVSGTNYAIDFELANGEVWNTRVYPQKGSMLDGCS